MNIGFIGAGRVATHLAHLLGSEHHIAWIYSRQAQHAARLAAEVGAKAIDKLSDGLHHVDLVFIAVNDQQISTVAQQLAQLKCQALVMHTSGSTHLDVLAEHGLRCGVFYPLQTFSFGRSIDWNTTPFLIEAQQADDQADLMQLAQAYSQRVYAYDSAQRLSLHLAAVFACNFSNYCYDMAKQVVDYQKVDFSLLYPLILETAHKVTQHEPASVQTGPAMRGDVNILNRHQDMLEQAQRPDLATLYQLLSQQILQRHQS